MKNKSTNKPNILAVDDYPANLVALSAVLTPEYNLLTATSGKESIEILKQRHDISLILMDLQMPDMDGYEAAAQIKRIPHCKEVPIIFITAVYKEDPFVKKGYEAGAVDYFSKPFDPEILKMKIGVYVSFRQRAEMLKERERQINETEELLRVGRKLSSVLETLPVGVLIADVEGRICQTNDQVAKICGRLNGGDTDKYGEVLGWWDGNGKMIKDKAGPLYRALHKSETSHDQPVIIKCDTNKEKVILGSASPLLGLDGHIVGAVVVIKDVTESKRIEEDLENQISKFVSAGFSIEEQVSHTN